MAEFVVAMKPHESRGHFDDAGVVAHNNCRQLFPGWGT
jgi:hypothetical protein